MLRIVPLYAVALALLFAVLSARVILLRRRDQVLFGGEGNAPLTRRMRVHANFAEYAPFTLLLLAFAEARGAGAVGLHLGCLSLLAGRLAHAVGVSSPRTDMAGRVSGVTGTLTALLIGAALIGWSYR